MPQGFSKHLLETYFPRINKCIEKQDNSKPPIAKQLRSQPAYYLPPQTILNDPYTVGQAKFATEEPSIANGLLLGEYDLLVACIYLQVT